RLQDDRLRVLRGADGGGRRAVRPQGGLPRPRHLHRAAVDPVLADGRGRRAGEPARRPLRRGVRGPPARADLRGARPAARRGGDPPRGVRRRRRGRGGPGRRPVRQAAGPRARHLRADPRALHPVRAARHLRPLDEDQGVLLAVPALQGRHLQAPEDLHALGPPAVSLLAVEDLAINFGGVQALDGVTFEVEAGQVFTIIGPNGAGKTTIFNLVSRIYDPTRGRVRLGGEDITPLPPHEIAPRGHARTFHNIHLFA